MVWADRRAPGSAPTTSTEAGEPVATYTYDTSSNLTDRQESAGTTSYSYHEGNRLTLLTCPHISRTHFNHKSEGRRLSKGEGHSTIKYLYDQDKVLLERDGSDNTVARYTHEGGVLYQSLISMRRGGASYHYLYDGLGSVRGVLDGSQDTQNSYAYEAFGQMTSSSENVANPYTYVGAYGVHWDPTPALYFMQARDPAEKAGRERWVGGSEESAVSCSR